MSEPQQAISPPAQPSGPAKEHRPAPRSLEDILRLLLTALIAQHREVVAVEDAEAIHKMRVTTRRAQASLDFLRTPNAKLRVRHLKKTLRRTRRMLSTVRNYDVFLETVEKDALARKGRMPDEYGLLTETLSHRRKQSMEDVKEYLQKLDFEKFSAKIGLKVETPRAADADERNGATSGREQRIEEQRIEVSGDRSSLERSRPLFDARWIEVHAADRLDQRLTEFHVLASQSHETTDPAELHQLRIAAKRVRYLLELVSEMGYGDATRALAWLRSLQDRIGEWHDYEALEDEIVGLLSKRRFLKEHLPQGSALLQIAANMRKKKEQLVAKLFPLTVPKVIGATCVRITRTLRRSAQLKSTPRRRPRRRSEANVVVEG